MGFRGTGLWKNEVSSRHLRSVWLNKPSSLFAVPVAFVIHYSILKITTRWVRSAIFRRWWVKWVASVASQCWSLGAAKYARAQGVLRERKVNWASGKLASAPCCPCGLSPCSPSLGVFLKCDKDPGLVERGFLPALTVFGSIFWNHLLGSLNRMTEKSDLVVGLPFHFLLPSLPHFLHLEGCGCLNHQGCAALCSFLHMKWRSWTSPNWVLVKTRLGVQSFKPLALQDCLHGVYLLDCWMLIERADF